MTDYEIIKALECCVIDDCSNCPVRHIGYCIVNAMKEALALINRQKAEIERLEEDNEALNSAVSSALDIVNSNYQIGRTDGIKEFAELAYKRLISNWGCLKSAWLFNDECYWLRITFDDLVKEKVGEEAVDEATAYKEWERANVGEE